jgi:hypothetical protein
MFKSTVLWRLHGLNRGERAVWSVEKSTYLGALLCVILHIYITRVRQ